MGKFLGDAELWDDTPVPPRRTVRALATLLAGLLGGALTGFSLAPHPTPPAPGIVVPAPVHGAPPALAPDPAVLGSALSEGAMLVAQPGKLERALPDGTGRAAVADFRADAAVAAGGAPPAALGGGAVVVAQPGGATRRLTPSTFLADGLAGDGRRILACGHDPRPGGPNPALPSADGPTLPGMVTGVGGGATTTLPLACPVAWASRAAVVAGAAAPMARFRRVLRGTQVLAGPPGGPLHVVLARSAVEAAAGRGATVGAIAISPDGSRIAVGAGAPGGRWTVLIVGANGGAAKQVRLLPGYEALWLGWSSDGKLGIATVDRRGGLAEAPPDDRPGDGYVLAIDPATLHSTTLLAGADMLNADGFAWSPSGLFLAVSSPGAWTLVPVSDPTTRCSTPLGGRLLAWPGGSP